MEFGNPIEQRILFKLGFFPVSDVILVTWIVMAFLIALAALVRLRLRVDHPGRAQVVAEAGWQWVKEQTQEIIGRDPTPFAPLVATLFLFIITANLGSLVSPFAPGFMTPTADVSTTAALASIVFFAVPFYGVAVKGGRGYLKTYLQPTPIMLPFNVISDISRTIALAVRLFGNMLSGEILFGVLLALVPLLLPLPLMFLSLITGTIQAYIFTILTIVYIGGAVRAVSEEE